MLQEWLQVDSTINAEIEDRYTQRTLKNLASLEKTDIEGEIIIFDNINLSEEHVFMTKNKG